MPAPPGVSQSGRGRRGSTAGGGFGYGGSADRGGDMSRSKGSTASTSNPGGGFGTYGKGAGTDSRNSRRGSANPIAAAAMMSDRDKTITRTGNPANPFGEISDREAAQIARSIAAARDSTMLGGALSGMALLSGGPVGPAMALAELFGAPSVSDADPISEAVADQYGTGFLSGLFGNYSDDPTINAAVAARYAARQAETDRLRNMPGKEPSRGDDVYLPLEGQMEAGAAAEAEAPPPGIYTPPVPGPEAGEASPPADGTVPPDAPPDDGTPSTAGPPEWLKFLQPYLDQPIDGGGYAEPDWMSYLRPYRQAA